MACGLPIIAFAIGGIPEIVTHDVNGKLVERGNTDDLIRPMSSLIEGASFRSKLGTASLERIRHHHSRETQARSYIALLETLNPS